MQSLGSLYMVSYVKGQARLCQPSHLPGLLPSFLAPMMCSNTLAEETTTLTWLTSCSFRNQLELSLVDGTGLGWW